MSFLSNLANSVGRDVSSLYHGVVGGGQPQKQQQQQPVAPPPAANIPQLGVPVNGQGFNLGHFLSGAWNQLNPLDNGRTFVNPIGNNRPGVAAPSALQQLTHNGATNMAGGIVKPLIRTSMALNNGIGNAEVGIAHHFGLAPNAQVLNTNQYINQSIGQNLNHSIGYTGTGRQIAGDLVSNVANVAMPGESKLVAGTLEKAGAKVLPQAISRIAAKVAGGSAAGAVSGAVGNIGGAVAGNDPLSVKGLANTALTGAKYGAVLGGAIPFAGDVAAAAGKGYGGLKTAGLVRPTNLSRAELDAATKVRNANQGYGSTMDLTENDMAHFYNAQKKLGTQLGMPAGDMAIDKALAAHQRYADNLQQRKALLNTATAKLKNLPVGMSTGGPNVLKEMRALEKERAASSPTLADLRNNVKEIHSAATDHLLLQNPTRNLPAEIRAQGGISSSAYNDLPKGVVRKAGMTADKMAQVLGFPSEDHLMAALQDQKPTITKVQAKAQALEQLKSGSHPFAEDYANAQKALTDHLQAGQAKPQLPTAATTTAPQSLPDPLAGLLDMHIPHTDLATIGHEVAGDTPATATLAKPAEPAPAPAQPKQALPAAPKAPSKLNSDSYANVFNVSKDTAKQELIRSTELSKQQPRKVLPKERPASTAAENTAKNPSKMDIPKVEAGNYEQARINPQLASHHVNIAADQALAAAKRTGLTTSAFGKMVEGTKAPRNAADQAAVDAYKELTNRTHATSQALGGNTPYVQNYFRHEWDLSKPEDAAKFDQLAKSSKNADPYAFEGLDRQPRVFKTIAEGEAAGFKLKNQNLADEIKQYGSGSAHALKQQALIKGMTEADMAAETKPHTFDLGGGRNMLLSDKGLQESKGYEKNMASTNMGIKAYRTANRGFKQALLSISQFHPINISLLRAAPTLAAEAHPGMALKGAFDTFAAQAVPRYSEKLQAAALKDGTIEASARLGTPIKFGSDYAKEGKLGFGNGGVGEKAIFERAMPAMHIQMVKGALADLKGKGIALDSPQAHALGTRINEIMGFVNQEVRNLDKGTQRRLGDVFLAPQFTRAKWATTKGALTQGGLAGSYARRAIVANSAAAAVVAAGVGMALKQKSDNTNDILLRSIFHPSVPTPLKDSKGNTMELGLPATQSSEVLGLLGFSLKRGSDNHLQVDWKPQNVPTNAANYGRSRLASLPATGLKLATNTDYAGKPLYDPNASLGTKATQAATTIGGGMLPIAGQGILQTNAVKSRLPQASQDVLNASAPGTNPVLKSIGASFGLTPRTDKTVGKGQQTTQYFNAYDQAKQGLNSQEQAAMTMVTGSKKNPVTGKYDIAPTADDSRAKATALLQNPTVIDHLMAMNQTLAKQGQPVDPLWLQNKDTITKYFQGQAMPPGGPDKIQWQADNKSWYDNLAQARTDFFNKLPPGDPNKPKSPLQYPTASPSVQNLETQFFALQPKDQAAMIKAHPELLTQFQQQHDYTNALRKAQGYDPLKGAPQASSRVEAMLNATPQGTDPASKKAANAIFADPEVAAYLQNVSEYNLAKNGALDQFQGNTLNQKALKAVNQLGNYGLVKNPDGSLALTYGAQGGTNSAIQPGAKGVAYNKFGKPGAKIRVPKGGMKMRSFAGKSGGSKQFSTPKLSTNGKIGATRMKTNKAPTAYSLTRKKQVA